MKRYGIVISLIWGLSWGHSNLFLRYWLCSDLVPVLFENNNVLFHIGNHFSILDLCGLIVHCSNVSFALTNKYFENETFKITATSPRGQWVINWLLICSRWVAVLSLSLGDVFWHVGRHRVVYDSFIKEMPLHHFSLQLLNWCKDYRCVSIKFVWDYIHKSYNAPVPYPTVHHSEQKCTHFCSEWCTVGYGTGALWCMWDCFINYSSSLVHVFKHQS